MNGQKNWWESLTIQGAVISILVFLAQIFKLDIGNDEITSLVVGILGVIGIAMTIVGRIRAKYVIK